MLGSRVYGDLFPHTRLHLKKHLITNSNNPHIMWHIFHCTVFTLNKGYFYSSFSYHVCKNVKLRSSFYSDTCVKKCKSNKMKQIKLFIACTYYLVKSSHCLKGHVGSHLDFCKLFSWINWVWSMVICSSASLRRVN